MHFGLMDLYAWGGAWPEATPHRDQNEQRERQIKGRQEVEGRTRQRRRTVTNRGLILEDRGFPHLVISHTCSEMGSHHPWRKTKSQHNRGRRENAKRERERKKKQKKEKSTGFRLLWNLKEEKENYCADFSMKKMCLFDHWINQKKQSRKFAQTLQW